MPAVAKASCLSNDRLVLRRQFGYAEVSLATDIAILLIPCSLLNGAAVGTAPPTVLLAISRRSQPAFDGVAVLRV